MSHSGPGCNANGPLEEVPGLWFPADLVILQAGTRIFRVFTTILKEKSPIFADMFSIPQPPSASLEMFDGVPVVRIPDDPVELEAFLKAIFDSEYFMRPPAVVRVEIAIGVLRLAHKYDVHYLRRRALQHLDTVYGRDSISYPGRTIRASLATIAVALEVGAKWLLPNAFYSLSEHAVKEVVMAGPAWDCLGASEKKNCLRVLLHKIQIHPITEILSFLAIPTDEFSACEDYKTCNTIRLYAIQVYPWSLHLDMFNAWGEDDWDRTDGLCEPCLAEAKGAFQRGQQAFWNDLPSVFDLPDWEQLEQMRRAAPAEVRT
ncbi:hypothetical protein DFH07DRAFT_944377 [Mycena maculata]|uniref:BTB domain-containing protein n=1 Tax=Mycena maculata TaxID=230809 RepID=A0AAD7I737_9AGAR|nr:hypothetical protein DFH07DRAFT_944377 [Mycena maculata]